MIRLPVATIPWTVMRVVTAPGWGANSATSAAKWTVEPSWSGSSAGYEVLECERVALPQVGAARLRYRMGVIDGKLNGVLSSGATPAAWDPATMTAMAPSLIGKEVRIQQCTNPDAVASDRTWQTVFWGQVEYEEDHGWAGSVLPSGERIYHLTDALARARKWMFTEHAFSGTIKPGPVGYNTDASDTSAGNRGVTNTTRNGVAVRDHVMPGAGGKWSDEDVIEHALTVTRPALQPVWLVPSDQSVVYLSGNASAIRVDRDVTAWSVLAKAADWKQGRGVVFLDWEDDTSTGSAVAPLTTFLACKPPFAVDFSRDCSNMGGSTFSWPGAGSAKTLISVDLIGDHRAVDSALQLGDPEAFRVEYLESVGEPIENLVTLAVLDTSLAKRWTTADETALAALTADKRGRDRWRPVGQRWGIPLDWDGRASNGNGSTRTYCIVKTTDEGLIDDDKLVSPPALKILSDLPILEGYKYTGSTPQKADGSSTATETTTPNRKPPLGMVRMGSNVYDLADDATVGLSFQVQGIDVWMRSKDDEEAGDRYFADNSGLSPTKATTQALCTVAITSAANPLRIARARPGVTEATAKSRKTIRHEGLALWIAHASAIYELDTENPVGGYPSALRGACASSTPPGILRDDRLALVARHELACRWYGLPTATDGIGGRQAGESKRSASWQLRAGGLAGGFETIDDTGESEGETAYPAIGKLVQYLYANGSKITLNTPITRVHYDHQQGVTTWTTDWQELDFA